MNPTKGVPPLLVATIDKERDPNCCAWFLSCNNPAYMDVDHPMLGWVPICAEHYAWIEEE
jgi:hypothetical protein